jgi:hypothetical protein
MRHRHHCHPQLDVSGGIDQGVHSRQKVSGRFVISTKANMESVEQFMWRYIAEHIAEEKRQQASLELFRRRFHSADCVWSSRPGTLECLQSEKIESTSSSGNRAEAISRRVFPLSENYYLIRYHLESRGDSWVISEVDLQCCPCDGKPGNSNCPRCHGTGWMNTNFLNERTTASSQKPDAETVTT